MTDFAKKPGTVTLVLALALLVVLMLQLARASRTSIRSKLGALPAPQVSAP